MPTSSMAAISSAVATGLKMNGRDGFNEAYSPGCWRYLEWKYSREQRRFLDHLDFPEQIQEQRRFCRPNHSLGLGVRLERCRGQVGSRQRQLLNCPATYRSCCLPAPPPGTRP